MPTATLAAPSHPKDGKQLLKREPVTPSWVGRVPQLKPGHYADGMPLHQVQYLCCKLILRPNKFVSRESLFDFGKVMREPVRRYSICSCARSIWLIGSDLTEQIAELLKLGSEKSRAGSEGCGSRQSRNDGAEPNYATKPYAFHSGYFLNDSWLVMPQAVIIKMSAAQTYFY